MKKEFKVYEESKGDTPHWLIEKMPSQTELFRCDVLSRQETTEKINNEQV